MGLNITHTNSFQFEDRNYMRKSAKDLLNRQGNSEAAEKIVERVFNLKQADDSQLAIIKASYQMNLNDSLKETLNYLKQHSAQKKTKQPVFGEIWNLFNDKNEDVYNGELVNFVINENAENIFAA